MINSIIRASILFYAILFTAFFVQEAVSTNPNIFETCIYFAGSCGGLIVYEFAFGMTV